MIRKIVRESRAAQGLPPTIEDPATRRRIAALLRTRAPYDEDGDCTAECDHSPRGKR